MLWVAGEIERALVDGCVVVHVVEGSVEGADLKGAALVVSVVSADLGVVRVQRAFLVL